METYRTGPTNIVATIFGTPEAPAPAIPLSTSSQSEEAKIAAAQALEMAATVVLISETPSLLEKWSGKRLKARAKEYTAALKKPEVLWTIAAAQMAVHDFPNPDAARSLMAIMDSESDFQVSALNPANAYGLMQIIPSNVKHISAWPLAEKQALIRDIAPVVLWVATIDKEIAINMNTGVWPETLIVAEPLWQIPFIAVLWREANLDLNRSFKWNGGTWLPVKSGKFAVRNKTFLKYINDHPDIFGDYHLGKTAILANLWKHGAPNGLRNDKKLTYLNGETDHITPVVNAYHNLRSESTIDSQIETLLKEIRSTNKQFSSKKHPFMADLQEAVKLSDQASNPLYDFLTSKP